MNILENTFDLFGLTSYVSSIVVFFKSCSSMELLGWGTACISLTGAFLNARQEWYSFLVWMVARQCRHKVYDILRKIVIGKKWKTKAYTGTTYQMNFGANWSRCCREEKAVGEARHKTTVGL